MEDIVKKCIQLRQNLEGTSDVLLVNHHRDIVLAAALGNGPAFQSKWLKFAVRGTGV